jgi:hypothetical protein
MGLTGGTANRKIAPIAISAMPVPVPITRRPPAGWPSPVRPVIGSPTGRIVGHCRCGRCSVW